MAKQLKLQPQPYRVMARKTVGWSCIGTANLFEWVLEGNFITMDERADGTLNHRELEYLAEAAKALRRSEKILRKLGKHLLKGEYGDH